MTTEAFLGRWARLRGARCACWLWDGRRNAAGYALAEIEGRTRNLHTFIWELTRGAKPAEGFDVDHVCRNRACVNPDHFEAVPHRVNVLRGVSPPAVAARQTHCLRGHALDGAYRLTRGERVCRACHRLRLRRWRERHVPGPRPDHSPAAVAVGRPYHTGASVGTRTVELSPQAALS